MKLRILVVDDEDELLEVAVMTLESLGFEAKGALDGPAAMQMIAEQEFDLVLLDITMPGISGLEMLEEIHSREAELRVLVMTGLGGEAEAVRALDLGAVGFLRKPFTRTVLREHIQAALESS